MTPRIEEAAESGFDGFAFSFWAQRISSRRDSLLSRCCCPFSETPPSKPRWLMEASSV
jgi:hypothetical protein